MAGAQFDEVIAALPRRNDHMTVTDVNLLDKHGGKSGSYVAGKELPDLIDSLPRPA